MAVSVTITAATPEALAAALAALQSQQTVAVEPGPPHLTLVPGRTDAPPRKGGQRQR